MTAKNILGSKYSEKKGIGTPASEYSEDGPFHCEDCIFQKKLDKDKGLCREKHVLQDMKSGLIKQDKKSKLAIVDLEHGCCRWVKPPKDK